MPAQNSPRICARNTARPTRPIDAPSPCGSQVFTLLTSAAAPAQSLEKRPVLNPHFGFAGALSKVLQPLWPMNWAERRRSGPLRREYSRIRVFKYHRPLAGHPGQRQHLEKSFGVGLGLNDIFRTEQRIKPAHIAEFSSTGLSAGFFRIFFRQLIKIFAID